MKKALLILILLPCLAYSQILREHTYKAPVQIVSVGDNTTYYMVTKTASFELYDVNHSWVKAVNVTPPSGQTLLAVLFVSKRLFDTDAGKLEFIAVFYDGNKSQYKIMREDGSVLHQFSPGVSVSPINFKGEWKLLASNSVLQDYSVYSLPGDYLKVEQVDPGVVVAQPFPNPASSSISLPYKLTADHGDLHIFSTNGQMVADIPVGPDFDNVIFDTKSLPSGQYIYFVVAEGGRSDSRRFIIQ